MRASLGSNSSTRMFLQKNPENQLKKLKCFWIYVFYTDNKHIFKTFIPFAGDLMDIFV